MKRKFFYLTSYILNHKSKAVWVSLVVLAILLPIIYIMLVKPSASKAAWWDGNYRHRTAYSFTATSAVTTERKVKIDVDTATLITAGKMQSDCDDVRFTDAGGQLLDFFIDTNTADCNNASTDFYIKLKDIKSGGNLVYLYYGNASAVRTSPGGRKNDFFALSTEGVALKGYWPLDEASGTRYDYVGVNDLTDNNTVTQATGKVGNAAQFTSASSESLSVTDNANLSAGDIDFSIATWVYLDSKTSDRTFVHKGSASTGTDSEYLLWYVQASDRISFRVANNTTQGNQHANSLGSPSTGTWYFVVAWHDSSANTVNIQVNDGTVDSTSYSSGSYDSSGNFRLGAVSTPTAIFMDGRIDNAMFSKKVLNSTERASLYNGGAGLAIPSPLTFTPSSGPTAASEETTPGPIAYWKFDEGTGQGVQDQTAQRNHGTLGATSSSSSDDPTWIEEGRCVIGKCLYFDGSNDFASAGQITMPRTGTFETWWRPTETFPSVNHPIFTIRTTSGGTKLFDVYAGSTVYAGWYDSTSGGDKRIGGTPASLGIQQNKWHHIVLTWTNGGATTLYIDGSVKATGSSLNSTWDTSSTAAYIGRDAIDGTFPNMFLDETKIYPYARSAAEIKVDYNAGAAVLGASDQKDYLSDGLVGYWKMDETATPSLDSSGNSNSGTWVGTAASAAGKFSNSISLDGDSDYVNAGSASVLDNLTSKTVSTWVYLDTTPSTNYRIFDKTDSGGTNGWDVYVNSDRTITAASVGYSGTNAISTTSTTVSLTTWTHITATFDASSLTWKIYINGTEAGYSTQTAGAGTAPNDSSNSLGIGVVIAAATRYFDGKIDEARIYNRVLSADDVRNLYNWAPGPVGYWNFDEGSGQSVSDITGVNLTAGTLGANSSSSTDDPTWTNGKYGKGLSFDGSSDIVNIPDSDAIDFSASQNFTVGFWNKFGTGNAHSDSILEKWAQSGSYPYVFRLFGTDRVLFARYDGTNNPLLIGTANISSGWHYITGVKNGSTLSIYIDGKLDTIGTDTTTGTTTNSSNLCLAQRCGMTDYAYAGTIDDLRIYNYARSPQQIVEDMNASHPTATSPVGSQVLKYGFDEQTGTAARNSIETGGIATGSISGATWKTKKECKVNGCLDFDGSNDVITVTNVDAIDLNVNLASGSAFTTWVFPDSDGEADTGQIFQKGTTTYCRTDTQSGTSTDLECSLDLETTDATVNVTGGLTIGQWNHIAMTYNDDSDDEISVYINGMLRGTSTNGVGRPATDTNNLLIGGTTTANFDGKIDEFNVYNSELTVDQVRVDMNDNAALSFSVLGASESADLADGPGEPPMAYWNFDEKTGTTVNDRSGTGYTGTFAGNAAWAGAGDCKFGACFKGDGSSLTGVTVSPSLASATRISASAWFRTTQGSGNRVILRAGNPGGYSLYVNGDAFAGGTANKVNFFFWDGSWHTVSSTTTVTDGKWHHVEGTYDGTTQKIYLDGKLEASTSVTSSVGGGTCFGIGRANCDASGYFDGWIDEIKIYNYARTAAQVAYDYNRGAPVGWWKLDECQGSTANDASGNGLHGTITIGASGEDTVGTCATSSTAWGSGASGKYSASLSFDGTDDVVTVANNSAINISSSHTISAWVNFTSLGAFNTVAGKMSGAVTGDGTNRAYAIWIFSDGDVLYELTGTTGVCNIYRNLGPGDQANIAAGSGWRMITGTYNGTTAYLYIDGKLVHSASCSQTLKTGTGDFTIGSYDSYDFPGKIDDVRVYNYAFSTAQVRKLLNEGAAVRYGANN